jgi:ABC transport system ATP-binding/permease protein
MTIFSCNNLSKKYERELLFDSVSFGLEEGERIGIIGKNGIGKTTLLNIIASKEYPDEGTVVFNNNVKLEYLPQNPDFQIGDTVLNAVMSAKPLVFEQIEEYHKLCDQFALSNDKNISKKIEEISRKLEVSNGWSLETEAKILLGRLGMNDYYKEVQYLSGGLKKRVSLARALLSNPELLILDEPTNHLDADSVQWLQDRLMNSSNSLLFVTHDRYFLDAVSTKIVEIDQRRIFSYPGNYEKYLERKESFVEINQSAFEHLLSRLRTELAWLQKGAKARRTKQKSRIDWAEKLKGMAKQTKEKKIKIELGKSFLGSRIIDAIGITKTLGGRLLFNDFTFIAKPGDRIGIIGPNGCGKSTLLNVLSGRMKSDTGTLKLGASAKIGFFTQENIDLKDTQSVIGSLREIAEYIDVGEGRDRYLTAKDLLNMFLFPPKQHSSLIGTLSGGEKRRLEVLRVLMDNPNVLLLDEPTNDFDIPTLNALEEYLENFYGTLLIVSHDRAFLDRTVKFIWAFDGYGNIKEYPGNYSDYLEKKEVKSHRHQIDDFSVVSGYKPDTTNMIPTKSKETTLQRPKKHSYKDQRELEELEMSISVMENDIKNIQELFSKGSITDYKEIEEKSNRLKELSEQVETATERWIELSEKIE